MEKTPLTTEGILKSGRFPAIETVEKLGNFVNSTSTFRLDRINAVILNKGEKGKQDRVMIHMDGSEGLLFKFDSYRNAKEFYDYIMDRW